MSVRNFIFVLSFLTMTGTAFAQQYTLKVKYQDCLPEKLNLYRYNGITFEPIQSQSSAKDSTFTFKVKRKNPAMYFVGQQPGLIKPVIFGLDKKMMLAPKCHGIQNAPFLSGEMNKQAGRLLSEARMWPIQSQQIISNRKVSKDSMKNALKVLDEKMLKWARDYKQLHPYLGKMANLSLYLSFMNNDLNYHAETYYLAAEYFHYVDFKDPDYNNIPLVADAFRNYAAILLRFREEDELKRDFLEEMVDKFPAKSQAKKYALGGIVMAARNKNPQLFKYFAKKFIREFKKGGKPDPAVLTVDKMLREAGRLDIGAVAPDFTMNDRDGNPVKLSDFRGKVLLLDFWASWCGPCRRENPNVKRMYQKYHDKGFDVLSVSLDRKRASWLQAIEKDGLPWHHVSDIKGWQCAAAQLYGVRSIPMTYLLDKDGKILAKRLRGPFLEAKLKEIFGE